MSASTSIAELGMGTVGLGTDIPEFGTVASVFGTEDSTVGSPSLSRRIASSFSTPLRSVEIMAIPWTQRQDSRISSNSRCFPARAASILNPTSVPVILTDNSRIVWRSAISWRRVTCRAFTSSIDINGKDGESMISLIISIIDRNKSLMYVRKNWIRFPQISRGRFSVEIPESVIAAMRAGNW